MSQKFLSDVVLSTLTAGSMLKLDSNGKIVEAVDGTDYISTSATGYFTASSGSGIYYSGDVRIGTYQTTVAPDAKLHIFDYQTTEPKLLIEDGNTGDASMQFKISSQSYTLGIDNSDSDKFVLSAGSVLGTGNLLEITSGGLAAFQNSVLVKGTLYINNQEEIQQGATEKIATFQNLGVERGYFEVTDAAKGYFYADGFKTGASTVGFLKSDGTVDTGDFFSGAYGDLTSTPTLGSAAAADTTDFAPASHDHNSDYVSINGGYVDSDFSWDGTHDFMSEIKVSGASATTTNTTALFYGTGGIVEKRDLGSAAFAATGDFDAAGTAAAEAGDVQDNLDSLAGSIGTAAYTASTDYATAAQGALADSALQSLPSHNHDGRYYTKTESDDKYAKSGDNFAPILADGFYQQTTEGVVLATSNTYRGLAFPNGGKNFVFEVSIKGNQNANHQGIFWGLNTLESIHNNNESGYKLTHQGEQQLHIRDIAGNQTQLTYAAPFTPNDQQWHRYKLVQYYNATTGSFVFKVYIDGIEAFNVPQGQFNAPPQEPTYFGFINYTGDVEFANWNVREITGEEDLVQVMGEGIFQPAGNYLTSLPAHHHDARYYTETEMDDFFDGTTAKTGYNKTNWDTAHGWGDHASAGYQPSGTYADGTTYQTYGTGNNGWLMPDYNNNTSNFMRMYYDDGSREFRMYSNHGVASGEAKLALYDGSVFNTLSSTNISQFKTAYGWGNHASAGYATTTALNSGLSTKADTGHKYHSFSNGQQFYDGYGQSNYLRLFTENAVFDNFRFRGYRDVEISEDGVNWNPYPMNLDAVFDGREETGINITHETKKFRFTIDRSTGWPTTALFVIQTTWTNTNGHTGEVILETWDGSQWVQKDAWVYNGFQRGYNLHTTTQVHDGRNTMRVTILMDWDDASHNYIPLRRILLLSNYSGSTYDMKPFYWNYNRDVTFANQIYVSGGNSTDWNTAYGWGNHASAGYLTSVPSEFLTQTEGDARYLQSLPAHNHDTLYDALGSADAVATAVNERIDTEVFDAIATVDGNIPTNNNQLTNGAGYLTAVPSAFNTTSIGIGNKVTISESTDRSDLLYINSHTSSWGGLQVGNTSNEFIFSLMGNGNAGGIYDDQNGDWIIYWDENAGVQLNHNNNTKLLTVSDGVNITGRLYASSGVQVPYGAGEHRPMVVLNGATNYGLFHTEATNDDFTFDFNGEQKFKFSQDGILTVNGNTVTTGKITNWDTAYGWGNHASQDYATTSYVDTAVSNLVDSAPAALNTLNELAAALGDDVNFSTTVTNNIGAVNSRIDDEVLPIVADNATGVDNNRAAITALGTDKLAKSGGTITGQVIFPSAATTKPVLPNGFISRNDSNDTTGRHDIWGISERYYPSNSTAGDAWGIQWSGTPNDIVFVGGGTDRVTISLDEGNITTLGTVTASGGNSGQWNTAFGWGNHDGLYDSAGSAEAVQLFVNEQNFATDAAISTAVSNYLPLSGGTITGVLTVTNQAEVRNWLSINKTGAATTSQEGGIRWEYNGSAQYYFYTDNANNGDLRLQAAGLSGETDNAPRLVIPRTNKNLYLAVSGGNVGIGNTDPDSLLDVGPSLHQSATGIDIAAGAGGANVIGLTTGLNHNWLPFTDGVNYYSAVQHVFRNQSHDTDFLFIGSDGSVYPALDRQQLLGRDTNRWQIVFCEILDSAGQHEKNLQNPEGEKSVGEYETGTVLVWKGGKNVPCTEAADHMRMGIAVNGIDSPLIQGAEPVLVTGSVNEGDYLVTSRKEGHAEAISPEFMRQHGLYDCVLGKALESAEGESHLVKTWINI